MLYFATPWTGTPTRDRWFEGTSILRARTNYAGNEITSAGYTRAYVTSSLPNNPFVPLGSRPKLATGPKPLYREGKRQHGEHRQRIDVAIETGVGELGLPGAGKVEEKGTSEPGSYFGRSARQFDELETSNHIRLLSFRRKTAVSSSTELLGS